VDHNARVPKAEVGDIGIDYEERGSGKPLLLITGIPSVGDDWAPLAEPLSESRRVITFDNRGCGGSTVTPGPYSMQQMAADAAGLLDHLEIDRADVFGISMGGMIAQELALGRPERVDRLALGCTHAGIRHSVRAPEETLEAFRMETDDWSERVRALSKVSFAGGIDPRAHDLFVEKKSGDVQNLEGYGAQFAAVLSHDTYDRLPDLRMPVLVLTGDDDRIIPAGSSRPLLDRIPDARLHVIQNAGHLFFIEQLAETRRALEAFFDDEPFEANENLPTPAEQAK